MSLHSNAFNFMSFVQGSVDPRTGQYTLGIDLPELNANALCGPNLPLQLGFNPLNERNTGFGIGWSLKLTRFSVPNGMLDLHTGESFHVADNGPGETAVITERKLESFQFRNISEGEKKRFRIAHKSGLTEILEPQAPNFEVALPVRVLAPSGHGIDLLYTPVNGQPCLATIRDDSQRTLLNIDYGRNDQVLLDLQPETDARARFSLGLQGDQLISMTLPGADQARWEFSYRAIGGSYYLTRLSNPVGGVETVTYKEDGHALPGVAQTLPYAAEHVLQPDPLDETTHMKNTYTFSSNNFLGNGAGVTWTEGGEDNLYKSTQAGFSYESTASHYLDGQVLRTVKRSFNRFHLMTEQVTTQQGCIETVSTTYHELANRQFADQPNYFQLPHKVTKTFTLEGNSQDRRDETQLTRYDASGNLVEEIQANGMRTVREYYPKEQSDGCPADPEGFVRNLKCETVYPAPVDDDTLPAAPIKRNRYRYVQLPGLRQSTYNALPDGWLALEQEDTFAVTPEQGEEHETLLHSNHRTYLNMPEKPLLHGRIDQHQFSMNGVSAGRRWRYELINDPAGQPTWMQTRETYSAPCGTLEATTRTAQSILSGQLVEEQDTLGVVNRYQYDVLNRVVEHTTAPDEPAYKATRRFAYPRLSEDGRTRTCEEVIDAKGVLTRIVYDGQNRQIREEREVSAPGNPQQRLQYTVSQQRYDSVGRLIGETFYDYPPDIVGTQALAPDVTRNYSYGYDGWGARSEVLRPDGIKEVTHATPFGDGGDLVTRWRESPDAPGVKQQLQVSQLNAFNKPVFEYRQLERGDQPAIQAGRTDFVYDGLGRCIKDTFSFTESSTQAARRVTEYVYDVWGRMAETVRPDGTALIRHFAPQSTGELTTSLQVRKAGASDSQTVCERAFDGLDRLAKLKVGPRVEEYTYHGTTQLVEKRTAYTLQSTAKGMRKRVIGYQYLPQLTAQPTHVNASIEMDEQVLTNSTLQANFAYEPLSADISTAGNSNGSREYQYSDQGYLAAESWKVAGQLKHHSDYRYSLQGQIRALEHSDVHDSIYGHDALGRVTSIEQGTLRAAFEYNSQGLLACTTTRDSANAERHVQCTQDYDSLGREVKRTLSATGSEIQVITLTWLDNDMLQNRTLERGGKEVRKETFEYDELDRLVAHYCEGEALPCNAKGRPISSQLFRFDELDNLTRCQTVFADGNTDRADFTYASDGSFKLSGVKHRLLEDYPEEQAFDYDELGNMLNDEQGRKLEYDALGRLQRVLDADGLTPLVEYQYDGHNVLVGSLHRGTRQDARRFLGQQLQCTSQDGVLTQYLYGANQPLGVQRYPTDPAATQLLLSDLPGSVIGECDADGTRHADYSAYGERPEDNGMRSLLAFNGEAREEVLGWYLLGSGYRAYNPALMRFHSPDSFSPEESGVNPYLYALGNPVNWRDPTGHRSEGVSPHRDPPSYVDPPEKPKTPWSAWLGVGIAALMLGVSVITMPWTAPASIGITLGYIAGIGGVAANAAALGIQAYLTATNDDNANLGYIAYGLSFLGGFVGGVGINSVRAALRTARAAQSAKAMAGYQEAKKNFFKYANDRYARKNSGNSQTPPDSPAANRQESQPFGQGPQHRNSSSSSDNFEGPGPQTNENHQSPPHTPPSSRRNPQSNNSQKGGGSNTVPESVPPSPWRPIPADLTLVGLGQKIAWRNNGTEWRIVSS
ncbi:RHS Repeat protein [compost metagenome]